jgi:hypothetical protein
MKDFLISVAIFAPAYFLFVFVLSQIIYPLFYSLPLSVYYTTKGELKGRSVLYCFIAPVMWGVAYFVAAFVLGFVSAAFRLQWVMNILTHDAVSIAFYVALAVCVGKLILKKYRDDIQAEYYTKTYAKFITEKQDLDFSEFISKVEDMEYTDLLNYYLAVYGNRKIGKPKEIILAIEINKRRDAIANEGGPNINAEAK